MALMPVHPALAGKWLQKIRKRQRDTDASRLEETKRKGAKALELLESAQAEVREHTVNSGWEDEEGRLKKIKNS